ncbi:MAG: hypothetical protein M1281_05805 [Chloroflexi bacterium]|nr:hypothetical protein [Chloroflexota bacterium]
MITIKIDNEEHILKEADEYWINQRINRRREDGLSVCVIVTIIENDVNIQLLTPTCYSSGGGSKPLNMSESRVVDLWNQRGLNRSDFTGGNLIAFIKQLQNLF